MGAGLDLTFWREQKKISMGSLAQDLNIFRRQSYPHFGKYSGLFQLDALEKSADLVVISIPVLALLILTLPFINAPYWDDELFSVHAAASWAGLWKIFHQYENNMSLYLIILHPWMKVFGNGELATHALSLLFAVLTLPVFYVLQRTWVNKTSAMAACILLAVSSNFVFYAVESRSYTMLVFVAVTSTLIFIRMMERPGYQLAICYGLLVAAAVYIHYFGALFLAVHGLLLYKKHFTRPHVLAYILAGAVIAISLSPLVLFPPLDHSQVDWLPKVGIKDLGLTYADFFGGRYALLVLAVCMVYALWRGNWKTTSGESYFLPRLALVWTVIPAAIVFLASNLVKPIFLTRYFIWSRPAAALLTCLTIGYTGWSLIRKTGIAFFFLVMAVVATRSLMLIKGSGYRDAAQWLDSQIRPGEAVLTYPFQRGMHVSFYLNYLHSEKPYARPLEIAKLPYGPGGGGRDPDPDLEKVRQIAAQYRKIFIVSAGDGRPMSHNDTLLNKAWLNNIEQIILERHPKQEEQVFGRSYHEPIKVATYE